MSSRNWNYQRRMNLKAVTKTANATLTKQEIMHGVVTMNKSSGLVITLPAARTDYDKALLLVININGSAKVTVAAGFGGAGTSYDYVTLAKGDGYLFFCNGNYWFDIGHTTAASS